MQYKGKAIEVLGVKKVLGQEVAWIRILEENQFLQVNYDELEDDSIVYGLPYLRFVSIAAKIKDEVAKKNILAPYESNLIPLPHQVLVLEKVMQGMQNRFLLADEVGMGKTIETGLILKELKLRGDIKRTLVIVPKSSMLQWQNELKEHFNELFHLYDSEMITSMTRTFSNINADKEFNFWTQHNQIIVSTDALKPIESRQGWPQERVDEYNKYRIEAVMNADFDLVVIDEAHKMGGATSTVSRFLLAQELCNTVPNVLLLTATPHRGKSDHFRRILNQLGIDKTSDVLDSTIEMKSVTGLYLRNLLDPEHFEFVGDQWLHEIKSKLRDFQSTEGLLPQVQENEIDNKKAADIKHSPLPQWLESLVMEYCKMHDGSYSKNLLGYSDIKVNGETKKIAFDSEIALNNPGVENLTLQNDWIRKILNDISAFDPSKGIPSIMFDNDEETAGYFSLWQIKAQNHFESITHYQAFFMADSGKHFSAYANDLWNRLITGINNTEITDHHSTAPINFEKELESDLFTVFNNLKAAVSEKMNKKKENRVNSYNFQKSRINKIGIANIRQSKLNRLEKEHERWLKEFQVNQMVIPDLKQLLTVRIDVK